MKLYLFRQNNSGGRFTVDKNLAKYVFIEACCESESMKKAEDIGIYLDGVNSGKDCACCGDRWYEPDEVIFPLKRYFYTDKNFKQEKLVVNSVAELVKLSELDACITNPLGILHKADGTIEKY